MAKANDNKRTTYGCYSPDGSGYEPGYPGRKKTSAVVKWYDVKMSFEEKARFNLLTYQEFLEWQQELMAAAAEQAEKGTAQPDGKTFWTNDTEERRNVSEGEYETFLSENDIDVSNRNSIDFGALENQVGLVGSFVPETATVQEETEDDILARVNKANGVGCERCLTDEEIAALFAAANN